MLYVNLSDQELEELESLAEKQLRLIREVKELREDNQYLKQQLEKYQNGYITASLMVCGNK